MTTLIERMALVLCVIVLCLGVAESQEPVAVVTTEFGGDEAVGRVTQDVVSGLSQRSDVVVLPDSEVESRLARRYGAAAGVTLPALSAAVEAGEDAYFQMDYESALAHFHSESVQGAQDAVVDMSLQPEVGHLVRRAFLGRARVHFTGGLDWDADEQIRASLRRFPHWIATTDYFQPSFVERYEAVRETFMMETRVVRVDMPGPECVLSVNGEIAATGSSVEVYLPAVIFGFRAQCGEVVSSVHVVDVSAVSAVHLDPEFDSRYDGSRRVLTMDEGDAENVARLAPMAKAYAEIMGIDGVIMVSVVEDRFLGTALQLVHGEFGGAPIVRVVRAGQTRGGAYPIGDALSALLDGVTLAHVMVNDGGGWSTPYGAAQGEADGGSGPSIAPWIVIGVGGAALITGAVFTAVESGAFSDFEDCRTDPLCSGTDALESHRSDGETAGTLALVGYSVGGAALVGGVLWLLLDSGSEGGGSEGTASWGGPAPQVNGFVGRASGVILGWRF